MPHDNIDREVLSVLEAQMERAFKGLKSRRRVTWAGSGNMERRMTPLKQKT